MIDCILENCDKKALYTETAFSVLGPELWEPRDFQALYFSDLEVKVL